MEYSRFKAVVFS